MQNQEVKSRDLSVSRAEDRGGNSVLISSRQQLHTLFFGTPFHDAVVCGAADTSGADVLRYRTRTISRVGLLRAMGARPGQVMSMILAEAAMITGIGGAGAGLRYDSMFISRAPGVLLRFVEKCRSSGRQRVSSFSGASLLCSPAPWVWWGRWFRMEGPPGRAIPVNSVRGR